MRRELGTVLRGIGVCIGPQLRVGQPVSRGSSGETLGPPLLQLADLACFLEGSLFT